MTLLSRVVWSEGMHLAQHYFQTQSRYFEDLTGFVFSSLFYGAYGFAGVELDAEALLNGTVALTHAGGLLPDGTPFHFPDEDPPSPLEIRELFSPTQNAHRVLLGLPAYRPDQANCGFESTDGNNDSSLQQGMVGRSVLDRADASLRYRSDTRTVVDEITGQSPRTISVARKTYRLLLDTQDSSGLVTMAAARIRRDGSGHFVYDPDYVPPSLRIGASRRLLELVGRLVELLETKAEAMAEERRRAGGPSEYASRELAGFWFTHAIHSALGPLRHFLRTRSAHPEELHAELARLAGALCTFSLDGDARTLPLYDHADPGPGFAALGGHIRRYLDVVRPSNCLNVALAPAEPGYYRGTLQDSRALHRAQWFLGVRSSASQATVIANVPRLVKVCSGEHIVKLVQRAFPGIPLEHVTVPPAAISPRLGMQYFAIQTEPPTGSSGEPCWKLIADTGEVGVYVPAAIPDVEVDLTIVLDS